MMGYYTNLFNHVSPIELLMKCSKYNVKWKQGRIENTVSNVIPNNELASVYV